MRSLGIITESIDVTIMPVSRTLVNIYEGKLPTWEKIVRLTVILVYRSTLGPDTQKVPEEKKQFSALFARICYGLQNTTWEIPWS